ncbi:MAG: hypothetical protein ACREKS_21915, partial [Candidatus Rokuibacteriota bacterium]
VSSPRGWAELHEETFRRLQGAVRVVVLDNLREDVLKPDIYDPTLNPPLTLARNARGVLVRSDPPEVTRSRLPRRAKVWQAELGC